jgi:4-hydroxybenzoyl-CoA reductase subunit beta
VTLAALGASAPVRDLDAAIAEAAEAIAGPSHRNLATVGGNLCLDTRCVYYNQSEWWRQANGLSQAQRQVCHVAPLGHRRHAAFSETCARAHRRARRAWDRHAGRERRMPVAQLYRDDGAAH